MQLRITGSVDGRTDLPGAAGLGAERFLHNVDLRAEKVFEVSGPTVSASTRISTNLLNRRAITGRQTRSPSTSIGGKHGALQAPTTIRAPVRQPSAPAGRSSGSVLIETRRAGRAAGYPGRRVSRFRYLV